MYISFFVVLFLFYSWFQNNNKIKIKISCVEPGLVLDIDDHEIN